jgi:hypothetical protein
MQVVIASPMGQGHVFPKGLPPFADRKSLEPRTLISLHEGEKSQRLK